MSLALYIPGSFLKFIRCRVVFSVLFVMLCVLFFCFVRVSGKTTYCCLNFKKEQGWLYGMNCSHLYVGTSSISNNKIIITNRTVEFWNRTAYKPGSWFKDPTVYQSEHEPINKYSPNESTIMLIINEIGNSQILQKSTQKCHQQQCPYFIPLFIFVNKLSLKVFCSFYNTTATLLITSHKAFLV